MGDSRSDGDPPYENQRAGRRVKLPIPVRLRIGEKEVQSARLRDASSAGVFLDGALDGSPGESALVAFDGYPDVCKAFVLRGTVARVDDSESPGIGVKIDRQGNPPETLEQYRKLVLHYIRHRPLLDDVEKGYFEGKCEACGWIGRVGALNPRCSRCGEKVVPIDKRP